MGVVAALNKVDALAAKDSLLPQIAGLAALRPFAAIVPVSAESGLALDRLVAEVRTLLPESPPLYGADEITDRDERFLAAEFVREKIFRLLGEEVPYQTTVAIDEFSGTTATCAGSARRSSSIGRTSARSWSARAARR